MNRTPAESDRTHPRPHGHQHVHASVERDGKLDSAASRRPVEQPSATASDDDTQGTLAQPAYLRPFLGVKILHTCRSWSPCTAVSPCEGTLLHADLRTGKSSSVTVRPQTCQLSVIPQWNVLGSFTQRHLSRQVYIDLSSRRVEVRQVTNQAGRNAGEGSIVGFRV